MMRAAAFLESSGQDGIADDFDKMAESHFVVRIKTSAANIAANRDANGVTGHERPGQYYGMTDVRMRVAMHDDMEDTRARSFISEFERLGIACPPRFG